MSGSLTVPVNVNFDSPLVVSTTQNNALDLEFDLAHPAFLIGHVPVGGGPTVWAVNFDGPVHRLARHDLTHLVLRHIYGDVQSISSDSASITITREFPTEPAVNPETAVAGSQSLVDHRRLGERHDPLRSRRENAYGDRELLRPELPSSTATCASPRAIRKTARSSPRAFT